MSNIRNTDKILVNRSNVSYQVDAQNIGSNTRDSDLFLVNRSNQSFQCSKANIGNIRDSDLVLVNRGSQSFRATGADFKSLFGPPAPGQEYNGGYFVGQINDGGTIYNIIVSPKAGGHNWSSQWKSSNNSDQNTSNSLSMNQVYGAPATEAYAGLFFNGTYPAATWCIDDASGPNAGTWDPTNTVGTGLNGYNDWYIPARYEMELLFRYLKPTTNNNKPDGVSGTNPYAVPPTGAYTATDPAQNPDPKWHYPSGSEHFNDSYHVCATQWEFDFGRTYTFDFQSGWDTTIPKANYAPVRVIRREPA